MEIQHKKIVLLSAVGLQFLSLFLTIISYRNYHTCEDDNFFTGFSISSSSGAFPITGILSAIWIIANVLVMRKTFKSNIIYIIMAIIDMLVLLAYLFFVFVALGSRGNCANGEPRLVLYSGFYVLLLSLLLYIISYFMLSARRKEKTGWGTF